MTPKHQSVRIIGGRWRSRVVKFDGNKIRPTPDRVRETVFNWLGQRLTGLHCLDLFCGSGALGLECLSRGAASCTFMDQSPKHLQLIEFHWGQFDPEHNSQAHFTQANLPAKHLSPQQPHDVIFIDPPYGFDVVSVVQWLIDDQWIKPDGIMYVEWPKKQHPPTWPTGWTLYRDMKTRELACGLLRAEDTDDLL